MPLWQGNKGSFASCLLARAIANWALQLATRSWPRVRNVSSSPLHSFISSLAVQTQLAVTRDRVITSSLSIALSIALSAGPETVACALVRPLPLHLVAVFCSPVVFVSSAQEGPYLFPRCNLKDNLAKSIAVSLQTLKHSPH